MNSLIVTADDYGMDERMDTAILQAHEENLISGASIVPNGQTFTRAITTAKNQGLPLGLHLGLILEEPVSPVEEVPSLVNSENRLPSDYRSFLFQYLSGNLRMDELKTEIRAQFQTVNHHDIRLTHVDSHQHLHLLPGIFGHVLTLAEEFSIPAVRVSDEYLTSWRRYLQPSILALKTLCRYARSRATNHGILTPDHYIGVFLDELLEGDEPLQNILQDLSGTVEIGLHLASEPLNDPYRFPNKSSFTRTFNRLREGLVSDVLAGTSFELTTFPELNKKVSREESIE